MGRKPTVLTMGGAIIRRFALFPLMLLMLLLLGCFCFGVFLLFQPVPDRAGLGIGNIDDKKSQTVEQIKDAIIELVHYDDNGLKTNLSDYL